MTEHDQDQIALEQRLRTHYARRYRPTPSPDTILARIQPELDRQVSRREQADAREQVGGQARLLSLLKKDMAYTGQGEKGDQAERRGKRRLMRALEIALAAMVVASLVVGWLIVTKWNTLGNGPTLYTYATQPGEYVTDLQWMPDSQHLILAVYTQATNHYSYLVWDARTHKARQTLDMSLPAALIGRVIVDAPNGRYALLRTTGNGQGSWILKLVDLLSGQSKQVYQATYLGKDAASVPAAVFSADSKYLAFIGADARMYVWNMEAQKIVQTTGPIATPGSVEAQWLTWSLDDQRLITKSVSLIQPVQVQMWNAQTGQRLLKLVETPGLGLFFWSPTAGNLGGLSLDGTRILTYNKQTGIFAERASQTLKILHTFSIRVGTPGGIIPRGQPLWVANDTRILFQDRYSAVYIWDSHTGKLLSTISLKDDPQITGLNIYPSPGGRYIAFGKAGNLVAVWDLITGKEALSIRPASIPQDGISWSPDGKYLAIQEDLQQGQIYEALSGKLIANYQGDYALISPDGRYIATQLESNQWRFIRVLSIK